MEVSAASSQEEIGLRSWSTALCSFTTLMFFTCLGDVTLTPENLLFHKISFFFLKRIDLFVEEIALLTKILYCIPKIFVKRFLLIGTVWRLQIPSCTALKTSTLARASSGARFDCSVRTRTRRKMACLAPIDAWRIPVPGTCVYTDTFCRRRASPFRTL
jgi:hypothetical protein